jgi:hypothetical protein
MESRQLNLIKVPILEGHNNNFPIRSLGLIHPFYKYLNFSLDINFLKVETGIRFNSANHYRNTYIFNELISFASKYSQREKIINFLINIFNKENEIIIKRLPYAFILYDVYYRNLKYNKEKSLSYKLKFSTDVILYHTMATLYFPYKAYKYSNSLFLFVSTSLKNPSIYLNILGFAAGVYLFFKIVKFGDIASDLLMNNSYRKFVFDYRNEKTQTLNEELVKIKELENRFYNK